MFGARSWRNQTSAYAVVLATTAVFPIAFQLFGPLLCLPVEHLLLPTTHASPCHSNTGVLLSILKNVTRTSNHRHRQQ